MDYTLETIKTKKRTSKGIIDSDYYSTYSDLLVHIPCPNCNSLDCLFVGVVSVGCRECMCWFDVDEFNKGSL